MVRVRNPGQTRSMTHTPPPSDAAQGGAPHSAPFGSGFFDWIRGLGISRGGDRWFAGVAGGIAQRAGIDPIIVRGIFIVLAVLGGPGLVLYLAGWLLLPDQGGRIHLEEVFRGRAGAAAVIATVAAGVFIVIPVISRFLGVTAIGGWSLWNVLGMPDWLSTTAAVVVWIAVIAAAGFLISHLVLQHGRKVRETPNPPAAPYATQPTQPAAPAGTAGAPRADAYAGVPMADAYAAAPGQADATADWSQRVSQGAERVGEKAARWSEDVGKQADEWSARYAQQHDLVKLGTAHVVITLALALLAAGAAAFVAVDLQLGQGTVLTAALLGATAVLAVSLIIAGVRGRNTGWVGFLAACGVIALLFTSVLPEGSRFQPFGTVDVGTTAPGSVLIAGTSDVDLTSLDRSGGTHDIDVWHAAGRSVITLPSVEPVVVTVRVLAGTIDASQVTESPTTAAGPFLSRTIDTRETSSEAATRVTVYMLAGSVRIKEGPPVGSRLRNSGTPAESVDSRDAVQRELDELIAQEEALQAELDSSRLSEVREERLTNTLDFTRDEIAKLEKELVR